MVNKAKGDYAYTLIDTNDDLTDDIVEAIKNQDNVINMRVLS